MPILPDVYAAPIILDPGVFKTHIERTYAVVTAVTNKYSWDAMVLQ